MGTPYALMAAVGLVFMVFALTMMASEDNTPKWKAALGVLGATVLILGIAYFIVDLILAPMRG